jgi:putative endopeptidase
MRSGQCAFVFADDFSANPVGPWGIDLSDRDPSVKPGDDFFMSQNGGWFARTELTPQLPQAAYWRDLRRLSPQRLNEILAQAAANKSVPPESLEAKAGAFYRAFMDEQTIEAKGLTPLKPRLDAIRRARTRSQIAALEGKVAGPETQRTPNRSLTPIDRAIFSLAIGQDQKAPERYAVYLGQAGLGLPGAEYYSDPQLADFKTKYESYVERILTLIEWPNPEASAREIVAFETRIAAASWSHDQLLDAVKTYNPMSVAALSKLAPGFPWGAFLEGAELRGVKEVVIDAPGAFPKIAEVFASTSIDVLHAYQAFSFADSYALQLNKAVVDAAVEFRIKTFRGGSSTPQPRGLSAVNTMENCIGPLMGSLYVSRYFSAEAKTAALEMAGYLKAALNARLQNLTWMSAATKATAREKLLKMKVNIGYPDQLPDYRQLAINDQDLYGDIERSTAFNWRSQVRHLNDPFDRSAWVFTPQTVNYAYSASGNALEIPAATLQPPFFNLSSDAAVNYGAIGALIGQQIIAGFDGRGRHYDADGRLHDWWSPEESSWFATMSRKLSDQYSAIEPLPGIHVKGELLVNESVGDLGGLLIALDAYHLSLKGKSAPVIDGFTGDQRFFLGRAQMWRAKFPVPFVRNQIATGNNAPPFLRVNGPVRNLDAWYEAFDVRSGDKLYVAPADRVRIW